MTTSNDPDAIRANIERTRSELSDNVDALADTANPKHIASRQADKVKDAARSVQERIMGSPHDDSDGGAIGDAKDAVTQRVSAVGDTVGDAVSGVGDTVAGAPGQVKQKAQGNPLAAGLIAFGAGLLISSLIPSSQKEQQAVSTLQENLEPLKEKATGAVQEMADNLKPQAQEAAESVKSTATDAVQNVKNEAADAKDQVQGQAAESKDTVQQERSS